MILCITENCPICCTHVTSPNSLKSCERVTIISVLQMRKEVSTFLRLCQGQTASRRQCQISAQENLTL